MTFFHGVHWLHLLVFIQETTTKNLQLLQTWVTNTLSCVWLWCTYTFLVEEMKRHQAAIWKHHARPDAPKSWNIKKSPLPHGSSAASLCVLEPAVQPTVAQPQESAGHGGGALLRQQPKECSHNVSSWLRAGQGEGHTDLLPFTPVTGWRRRRHSISTLPGKFAGTLQSHPY